MNVQKFFAPTARDALRRVKEALGADAIVLANRAVDGGVEILALPAEAASLIAKAEESTPVAARPAPSRPAPTGSAAMGNPFAASAPPARAPAPPARPAAPAQAAARAPSPAPRPQAPAPSRDPADDYTVSLSSSARRSAPAPAPAPTASSAAARTLSRRPVVDLSDNPFDMGGGAPAPAPAPVAPTPNFAQPPQAAAPAPSTTNANSANVAAQKMAFAQRIAQAKAQAAMRSRNAPAPDMSRSSGAADRARFEENSEARAESLPKLDALPEMPAGSPQVMQELRTIRAMIERQLAGFAWGEMSRQAPARTLLLGEMLDAGFSAQLARRLIDTLPNQCELADGRSMLKNALARELRVLGSDDDLIDAGGVFALVGPTGVGKTTSTAKLAARCVVRHGPESLALLTTDRYRIGAHEQLRIYGRILGVPVHVVKDAAELRRTLTELRQRHMVLIDTAGVGQRDRMVTEQTSLLTSVGVVKRLLLLNATSRGDTLDDVVTAYAGSDLAGCVVTKVDEAASLAPVVDVMIRNRLQCAYIANGQRVPEDLHLANRAWLLVRALRRPAEDSPHSLQGEEASLVMTSGAAARSVGEQRV